MHVLLAWVHGAAIARQGSTGTIRRIQVLTGQTPQF